MATIWVISDTHFGHANILKFSDEHGTPVRTFTSSQEMDEVMVDRWNKVVRSQDHVYHLGDVAIKKKDLEIVKRLNGHKRLVRGNHDIFRTKDYLACGFEEIHGMRVLSDCVLTHAPIHPMSVKDRWYGNIHGHIHERRVMRLGMEGFDEIDPRYLNVSVEQTSYWPITIEDAIVALRKQQEGGGSVTEF